MTSQEARQAAVELDEIDDRIRSFDSDQSLRTDDPGLRAKRRDYLIQRCQQIQTQTGLIRTNPLLHGEVPSSPSAEVWIVYIRATELQDRAAALHKGL